MKLLSICFISFLIILSNAEQWLYAHGFIKSTPIKINTHQTKSIRTICHDALDDKECVISYDFSTQKLSKKRIAGVGKSTINCYCKISLDEHPHHDIICAPTQEFYVPEKDAWIPAYDLALETKLIDIYGNLVPIVGIEFFKNTTLKVYSIEVNDTHNFFVGNHGILVHNMALPALSLGFIIPLGSGAVAGGSAGGCFGPIALVGGCCIGGLIGVAVKGIMGSKIPHYKIMFSTERLGTYFAAHDKDKGGKIWDIPQKDNRKWVKLKNGQGWLDKERDEIWIRDKSNHGGPHWDILKNGKQIREVDINGKELWPNGPKNKGQKH